MSVQLFIGNSFEVLEYYGGDILGPCLQITMQDGQHVETQQLMGAIQLDLENSIDLYNQLGKWIKRECIRRHDLLREEVANTKELEKTVFSEIAALDRTLIENEPIVAPYILRFAPITRCTPLPETETETETEVAIPIAGDCDRDCD